MNIYFSAPRQRVSRVRPHAECATDHASCRLKWSLELRIPVFTRFTYVWIRMAHGTIRKTPSQARAQPRVNTQCHSVLFVTSVGQNRLHYRWHVREEPICR